jgi:3-phytase
MRPPARRGQGWVALALSLVVPVVLGVPTATPSSSAIAPAPVPVPAADETVPVLHSGDAADDPAIWVHPTDRSRSLVIGNDKGPGPTGGALETYDLEGDLVQRISSPDGFWGNVDVRQGVGIPTASPDVVAVAAASLRLYAIDPATLLLRPITDGSIAVSGEGLCLYDTPNALYAFVITRAGVVRQVSLTDADGDGLLAGQVVRSFTVGSEAEGCVADDATGALYISEEEVALWRYSASPADGTSRTAVDTVAASGGNLTPDIEGLTIVDQGSGAGYLIASAQNGASLGNSSFAIYGRSAPNTFVKLFRVTNGTLADDCDGTDGIAAYAGDLGPRYPDGLFVCQDNNNAAPGSSGNQNFKLVDLADIVAPPVNQPPVGAFSAGCTQLTCELDASASADPDGTIVSWAWQFGDGATASGETTAHTWDTSGTWPVSLTVTDDLGATGTVQHTVTVSDDLPATLSFVGAHSTNGNRLNHGASVPPGVSAGDRLLLFFTANTTSGAMTPPPGWTQLMGLSQDGVRAGVWTRIAGPGDAGSGVLVRTSAYAKSDLTLTAHRSSGGTPAVAVSAYSYLATPGAVLTSPVVTATQGSWLVTCWGAKGGEGPWTAPSGQLVRAESHGTGGGPIHGLTTDTGAPVPAGPAGGLNAGLAVPPGRAVVHSVVLSP